MQGFRLHMGKWALAGEARRGRSHLHPHSHLALKPGQTMYKECRKQKRGAEVGVHWFPHTFLL